MSTGGGFDSGGGPSWLNYETIICPKCGDCTTIRVSHSYRNPNKLYYWCNTHRFVDWCLPTNVGNMNPASYQGIRKAKCDEDFNKDGDHDLKFSIRNKLFDIAASCKGNSIPSLLCFAVVLVALVSLFIVLTPKLNAI